VCCAELRKHNLAIAYFELKDDSPILYKGVESSYGGGTDFDKGETGWFRRGYTRQREAAS